MREEVALGIQTDDLAARAEARVDGHRALLSHGRGQEELPQVFPEDVDAFDIGLFLGLADDFSGDGGVQEALPGVVHGFADLEARLAGRVALRLAVVVVEFIAALFSVGVDVHFQEAFFLGAEHGQQVVCGYFADGLAEAEVVAVLGGLGVFGAGLGGLGFHAAGAVDTAQRLAVGGGFADALGDDVAGALEGFLDARHLPFHVLAGFVFRAGGLASPEEIGQRLQASCDSHRRARLALGAERQVQVLELGAAGAVFDLLLQGRGELFLLLDGLEDGCLALFHLFEDLGPVLDLGHVDVVQAAGALLAVAADEGNGAAVGEELGAVLHLPGLDAQQLCYIFNV